jgi:Fe-S cluster biosynthesis and repair protein YggX
MGMEIQARISQWENMTQADPTNDMAWFSLGNAYRDAGRLADADRALAKALQLNPAMSRAYQLRGQVLIALNRNEEAAKLLAEGYRRAAERGDVMPQRAMGSLLEKLGQPVPEVQRPAATAAGPASGDTIIDRRTGRPGTRLADPPMRGPLGRFIYDHFSQETWREWIGQGTKVINELRLDFSNDEHQKVYERHMMEWLGISPEEVEDDARQSK